MSIEVSLTTRNGITAKGIFSEYKFIVLKGSKIQLDFADHIRGGKSAKKYREDENYVDSTGVVLKDCAFTSPSTAAQFITGRSTNGYVAWRIDDKTTLKKHLGR